MELSDTKIQFSMVFAIIVGFVAIVIIFIKAIDFYERANPPRTIDRVYIETPPTNSKPRFNRMSINRFEALLEQSLTKFVIESIQNVPPNLKGTPVEGTIIMGSISDFIEELTQKLYALPQFRRMLTKEEVDYSMKKVQKKVLSRFFDVNILHLQ